MGQVKSARIAQQYFRGLIKLNQQREFRGPSDQPFTARALEEVVDEQVPMRRS